ncbi:unnamed protein product [marine sediment metagenome]|uniref:Uncharacterized protein n=1 Tax=marine sediment metagenome TaxID=412755 RepID=X0T5P2_9ZZZZ
MLKIGLEYFLFIFLASLGVLQIAASYANLNGLSFFKKPTWGYIFGSLAIVGGFSWFYIVGNPHPDVGYAVTASDILRYGWSNPMPPDIGLILGDGESVGFFLLAVGCAILTTIAISSIVKFRLSPRTTEEKKEDPKGLEALREMTFFQAITRILRNGKGKE